MADNKKTKIYFWLKLDENFYKNIIIKKARKTNDTMVIVYQRLMLQSLATNGYLYYEGAFENIADELAMSLDEDVEQVQMTLAFFSQYGLIQFDDENNAEMLQVHALIDQETNWARYRRDSRKKEKVEKLDNVQPVSNQCPTEIELEIEKELKIDIDIEKDGYSEDNDNLFQEYIDLFIDFAPKNKNKRGMALQTFLNLSQMEKQQILLGAKNYIEFYKADRPDDTNGQYSVNAYDFLDNAVFKEYQEKPKVAINAYTSDGTNDGWTKNKAWANK